MIDCPACRAAKIIAGRDRCRRHRDELVICNEPGCTNVRHLEGRCLNCYRAHYRAYIKAYNQRRKEAAHANNA